MFQGRPSIGHLTAQDLLQYWEQLFFLGTAQDPIMPYPHEPFREHMHCKPPDELFVG